MDLIPFRPFLDRLAETRLAAWREPLEQAVLRRLAEGAHGDLDRWESALATLPDLRPGRVQLARACVGIELGQPLAPGQTAALREALMGLHPWRKGPYCLCGVQIDSEWRSDLKWDRLADRIEPLDGRLVLDVGCGNGYYAWRMLAAGARLVLGIDPNVLCAIQFQAVNRYLARDVLTVLPLALEDLPKDRPEGPLGFDTVFSMGVLCHRRSPMDHLFALRRLLRPGGELVLETLVVPGTGHQVLVPPGRYAAMRNCWFIPTADALAVWLGRCGFRGVRVLDVSRTTTGEQRQTDWMRFESLADHLDPLDPGLTREGHPAPTRALLVARNPP